jgi:hypothetical protein
MHENTTRLTFYLSSDDIVKGLWCPALPFGTYQSVESRA